jgi:hypothetical protein
MPSVVVDHSVWTNELITVVLTQRTDQNAFESETLHRGKVNSSLSNALSNLESAENSFDHGIRWVSGNSKKSNKSTLTLKAIGEPKITNKQLNKSESLFGGLLFS